MVFTDPFLEVDEAVAQTFADVAKDKAFKVALASIRTLISVAVSNRRAENVLNCVMEKEAWNSGLENADVKKELYSALGKRLVREFNISDLFTDDIGCQPHSSIVSDMAIKDVTESCVTMNFKETFRCDDGKAWCYDKFVRLEAVGRITTTIRSLATGSEETIVELADKEKAGNFVSFCCRIFKRPS